MVEAEWQKTLVADQHVRRLGRGLGRRPQGQREAELARLRARFEALSTFLGPPETFPVEII